MAEHSGALAWRTAIGRKALSKPARWLGANGRLCGRLLDYGCGRGGDAERLDCASYDPHFRPDCPRGPFETIICNYVLNVIEDYAIRRTVLRDVSDLLADDGVAYFAVRTNKKDLRGLTRIGTWQGLILLDLPVVYKDSDTTIYEMRKGGAGCAMYSQTFPK